MKLHDLHESAQSDADLLMLLFSSIGDGRLKRGKLFIALEQMDGVERAALIEQAIYFARVSQGSSILNDLIIAKRSLEAVKDILGRVWFRIDNAKPTLSHPVVKDLMSVFELSKAISMNDDHLSLMSILVSRLEMYQDELRSGDISDTLKIDETDVAFIEATFKKLGMI